MKKNIDPRLQGTLDAPCSTIRKAYVSPRLEKLADVSGDTRGGDSLSFIEAFPCDMLDPCIPFPS